MGTKRHDNSVAGIISRIKHLTGACLFEISTPDDKDKEWEVSAYYVNRHTAYHKRLSRALLQLECLLVMEKTRVAAEQHGK